MKIAFVGGGNMAAALIGGLRRAGDAADLQLHVIEPEPARRAALERDFAVTTAADQDETLRDCDALVLAVKPQQLRAVCATLAPRLDAQLVVSIAAGIRARDLARWLGSDRIVRAMPNTPALVGHGIAGLMALGGVAAGQRALAERILRACGKVVWFERDEHIDAVTAVSGSGPAYVFHFIEAMIQAGQELGFDAAQARALAVETVLGAGVLAAQSTEPVGLLRERVTSKGGTTAAALAAMAQARVAEGIVAGVHAAARRAAEMGDEFGRD